MLVDFRGTEMTGKHAQELLDRIRITANKNSIPGDHRPPTITSGLRLGTPAMTTRGFGAVEMREVGSIITELLTEEPSEEKIAALLLRSRALTAAFPLYRSLVV
jgi:glycine hydroxymethyltransferase